MTDCEVLFVAGKPVAYGERGNMLRFVCSQGDLFVSPDEEFYAGTRIDADNIGEWVEWHSGVTTPILTTVDDDGRYVDFFIVEPFYADEMPIHAYGQNGNVVADNKDMVQALRDYCAENGIEIAD